MDLREKYLRKVREKVKKEGGRRDIFLAHVIRSLEDIEKTINLLGGRLKEWYSYYFPEMEIKDVELFARAVLAIDEKENIDEEKLAKAIGYNQARKIVEKAKGSVGGDISKDDLVYIKRLAEEVIRMVELRDYYEENLDKIASSIAPNATYIAGGKVVAKLISHAGGLEKIAEMPASTIQVLGAEKALFKYLKKRAKKPPKHGIILLHPYVASLPKKLRGKMARTLAAKLAIAFKVDAEGGEFVGKKLKEEVEKRYKELKEMAKKAKR